MRTLIIDNYDSFTFNLFQQIARVAQEEPIVIRNDQMTWSEARELPFDNIVLSPGPGHAERPADFGICADAIKSAHVPILGVCLGHQGIAHLTGGRIVLAPEPMHGRLSKVHHGESGLFAHIPSGFDAVRYHSLMVERPLPPELEVTAWTEDGVVMGLRHRSRPLWGVQFHPESICSQYGERLIENFNRLTHPSPSKAGWSAAKRKLSVVPQPACTASPATELELVTHRLDTLPDPERVFLALYSGDPTSFWLDSSMVREGLSRFSFMGNAKGPLSEHVSYRSATKSLSITRGGETTFSSGSIFDYLQQRLASCRVPAGELPFDFNCGFVGYFGYELKQECGAIPGPQSQAPDAQFIFADRLIAFDAKERTTFLVALVRRGQRASAEAWISETAATLGSIPESPPPLDSSALAPSLPKFELARDRETYLENIGECFSRLRSGETYEVCLTNKIRARSSVSALDLHRRLRRSNPVPYAAYLSLPDMAIACSSPERFLRVEPTGWMNSRPIKGTAPRGGSVEEDERNKVKLRTSEKERSENLMIVDLVRNDLGRVAEIGSVSVPELMHVETYATVHQLVSTIEGRLREGMTAVDAVRVAFPGGSMTGAPKRRTMQIIDGLEKEARGVYSGSIGYLSLSGAADLNIVIRTAVVADSVVSIGVGGAVVALSDASSEFDEMVLKSKAVMAAILASAGEPGEAQALVERIHRRWCQPRTGRPDVTATHS